MTVVENLGPLVGRAVEIEVLRSEVAAVRTGIPRIVVVQGDAGIGKTALIENVLAAEHGLAVLRTSGEPWEASVPHGVIDQLMCVSGIDASHGSPLVRSTARPCSAASTFSILSLIHI